MSNVTIPIVLLTDAEIETLHARLLRCYQTDDDGQQVIDAINMLRREIDKRKK